ncbi:MAG: hypothetical protein KCHDKBKB_02142 [Elusimicrobia bacterium]|nr:hypothetical protein [Elusimicrobiota bacterium]
MRRVPWVAFFLLLGNPLFLFADRRPPETLCQGGACGSSYEIPVHSLVMTGGVGTSTPTFRDRGHNISFTVGEAFSGQMKCSGGNECSEDLRLDMGHGFFEFYSDRIPMYDVSLTVNGGSPVTNQLNINLGVQFKDDLSGFLEASFTQQSSGRTELLELDSDNFFEWSLGEPHISDGDYLFQFWFKDRAGNVTVSPATASVTLDRVPPHFGAVSINNGDSVTGIPLVRLDLQASDDRTGVTAVRLANSTSAAPLEYPFIAPRMAIEWLLDISTGGEKTVYAWYRDRAGNWSTRPSTDTINLYNFRPDGTLSFVADGTNVVETAPGQFQTKIINVPVKFDWDASLIGILRSVKLSGGPQPVTFDLPTTTNVFVQPYIIAPESGPDGLATLRAVFIDITGRETPETIKTIYLDRTPPPTPSLENLQTFSSSLTFVAQIQNTKENILYYTVIPDPSSILLGASSATIPVALATAPVTFTDLNLRPNTPYIYTVRAFDPLSGSVDPLVVGPVVTLAQPPLKTVDPQGVEVSVIRVAWGTANNPGGTEFRVFWSKNPAFPASETSFSDWTTQNPMDIQGLDVGTLYHVRVAARNSENKVTPHVDLGTGRTLSYIQPQPPVSFYAEQITATSIVWAWVRNPSTEQGFHILNSTGGLVADIPLKVSTNVLTYEERDLAPNSLVSRTIFSYNFLNDQFTASASRGATAVTPPAAPSAEPLTALGSEITAHWGPNGNSSGTEYQAEIALNESFTDQREASDWTQEFAFPFRGLAPQTTYYARVRARGHSHNDIQLVSNYVFLGAIQTRTFGAQNELDLTNSAWQLRLPPNAMDQDFAVRMEEKPSNFTTTDVGLIQRATDKAYRESNGYRFPIPGGMVEVTLTNTKGASIDPILQKPGELIHLYQLSNGRSIQPTRSLEIGLQLPDPMNPQQEKNILAKTLRLWVLDPKTESWFRLPSNDVDLFLSRVEGGVQRFGVFAVMGAASTDVNEVVAFPVPWRPSGPNAGLGSGQTGTEAGGITFANIPQEGTLRIVDLQGALVKEIQLIGNPTVQWDVRTTGGEKVASGTYYWIAESGGNKKTGKLMVIR